MVADLQVDVVDAVNIMASSNNSSNSGAYRSPKFDLKSIGKSSVIFISKFIYSALQSPLRIMTCSS